MISVIIPAYNEEKKIEKCLGSLLNQITTQKFEVIVVDNNSSDKTAEIARLYKSKLNLKIIVQKIKGRGAARQKGFQQAEGEIILSTDADTIVPPSWIELFSKTLKDSNAIAVTGTCKMMDCDFLTNTILNISQPLIMRIYRLIFGHYWLSGFSFGIYKSAYIKSGGFNKYLNALEDIDLSFKVSRIGQIKFISNLPVIFSGRRFKKGLIKGILPYLTTFITCFFYKNEKITMSDIR